MMDARSICLVIAILSLSVSSVVIWSSFLQHGGEDLRSDKEREIRAIIRSLRDSQNNGGHRHNASNEHVSLKLITSQFPWLAPTDLDLHNFFTQGYVKEKGEQHLKYTQNPLVILPFFHDKDGQFEQCLRGTGLAHNEAVSPKMTLWNRFQWDHSTEGFYKFKHKFKIHFGDAAFSLCFAPGGSNDRISAAVNTSRGESSNNGASRMIANTCGRVLLMQDPVTLAVAEFGACLLNPNEKPICQFVHNHNTSLESWIARRGNVVFKNILFGSDVCQQLNHPPFPHHEEEQRRVSLSSQYLCDRQQGKLIESLEPAVIKELISFIVRNISHLFSIVGIYEDFLHSIQLFHHVFRLPLHECKFLSKFHNKDLQSKHIKSPQNYPKFSSKSVYLAHQLQDFQNSLLPTLSEANKDELALLKALSSYENRIKNTEVLNQNSLARDTSMASSKEPSNKLLDYDILDLTNEKDEGLNNFEAIDSFGQSDNIVREELFPFADLQNNGGFNQSDDEDENYNDFDDDSAEDSENETYKNGLIRDDFLPFASRRLKTNDAWERLYNRLGNSESVRQSLSLDIQIYKAVKKLYLLQKRIFFNSLSRL